MKDEVEDFLRRVAQMRAEAQAKGQQPRPAPPKPPAPRPARTPPPQRLVPARPEPIQLSPLEVEIVDAELADTADRLGQQVRQDMRGTEEIAEHTRHLGAEVDARNAKMQAHMHEVFDHKLGHLKQSSGGIAAAGPMHQSTSEVSLSQIQQMLSSPQSIRDAVIMAEILNRPVHLR
jgi:hypothetical protein